MRNEIKSKYIYGTLIPDDIRNRNKWRDIKKTRLMQEENVVKVLRKIVNKTKMDRIRSQIRESCGIHPINEWVESSRR